MFGLSNKKSEAAVLESLKSELERTKAELDHYKSALSEIGNVTEKAAKGDYSARITYWDEFGDLSPVLIQLNQSYDLADAFLRESGASLEAALNREYHRIFLTQGILGDLGRAAQIINSASAAMQTAEIDRRDTRGRLTTEFETQVLSVVTQLSNVANSTSKNAEEMMSVAQDTQARSNAVAAAAEQATVNVQTVAAAVEEQSATTMEISRNISEASQGTMDVSSNISEVSASTNRVLVQAQELRSDSTEMQSQVNMLRDQASRFIQSIRDM